MPVETTAPPVSLVEVEDDPTPIVMILATTLRRAEHDPQAGRADAQGKGNVALRSTVDPQAATIRFQRGRVLVERASPPTST